MKKIIFSITLMISIINVSFSQISILTSSGKSIEGTEQIGIAEEAFKFFIKNNGSAEIELEMTATKVKIPVGARMMQICGNGLCQSFDTDLTIEKTIGNKNLKIPAGATSPETEDFHVEYNANGVTAEASATVRFYEKGNESNSVTVDIIFFKGSNSINSRENKVILVHPNPANNYVYVNFNGIQSGEFVIRNIVGKEIKRISITSKKDNISIPVSDLQEGVYLYSVIQDGKTKFTKKLIINH